MTKAKVLAALREAADAEKAAFYPSFFKAGKGEYAEGDKFLGVVVPEQRKIARRFRGLPRREVEKLLDSPWHECRLTGLLILVERYQRGGDTEKESAAEFYLRKLDRVNNWDLVDASAHKILGPHLEDRDRTVLYELAGSGELWRERVAVIATLHFIKQGEFDDTLRLADLLLEHEHDLIHKAVGWMVREVGKQHLATMERFLKPRYQRMPRTMLRYAIEKLPEAKRKRYLAGKIR
ncbi:MAG: DNA alkylation repair protein [Planctomycetota bacterium]